MKFETKEKYWHFHYSRGSQSQLKRSQIPYFGYLFFQVTKIKTDVPDAHVKQVGLNTVIPIIKIISILAHI